MLCNKQDVTVVTEQADIQYCVSKFKLAQCGCTLRALTVLSVFSQRFEDESVGQ